MRDDHPGAEWDPTLLLAQEGLPCGQAVRADLNDGPFTRSHPDHDLVGATGMRWCRPQDPVEAETLDQMVADVVAKAVHATPSITGVGSSWSGPTEKKAGFAPCVLFGTEGATGSNLVSPSSKLQVRGRFGKFESGRSCGGRPRFCGSEVTSRMAAAVLGIAVFLLAYLPKLSSHLIDPICDGSVIFLNRFANYFRL